MVMQPLLLDIGMVESCFFFPLLKSNRTKHEQTKTHATNSESYTVRWWPIRKPRFVTFRRSLCWTSSVFFGELPHVEASFSNRKGGGDRCPVAMRTKEHPFSGRPSRLSLEGKPSPNKGKWAPPGNWGETGCLKPWLHRKSNPGLVPFM